jgi:hypothetical protein
MRSDRLPAASIVLEHGWILWAFKANETPSEWTTSRPVVSKQPARSLFRPSTVQSDYIHNRQHFSPEWR